MINPSVFDRVGVVLFFLGDFQRKTALALLDAPDVSWVTLKLNGQMIIGLWTRNKENNTDCIKNILGIKPAEQIFMPYRKSPPLSITDLSIMDALIDEPRSSIGELVKSTDLSPKTVRKHLNQLLETKTISIVPLLGAFADSGEVIYPLVIIGRVNMSEVRKILDEAALLRSIQDPPMKYVLCKAHSLAGVTAKIRALENVQGLKSATLSLNREILISTSLRHSLIREKIEKFEKEKLRLKQAM